MRRLVVLVLVCGCSDNSAELDAAEVDAQPADAEPNDGRLPVDAAAVECVVGATPMHAPVAGTYCVTWTRIDGSQDPFARYYDRAEVSTSSVRWFASDMGEPDFIASAGVQGGCLLVSGFTANGGAMRSAPISMCWSSEPRACGAMTWRSPGIQDGHWTVQLDACP